MFNNVVDLRLTCDRTMCIAGSFHSGKTYLTLKLIDHRDQLFECRIGRVVWCYGIYQSSLHTELEKRGVLTQSETIHTSMASSYELRVDCCKVTMTGIAPFQRHVY